MKKICVLGLGYIGLPTASLFAVNGYNVVGVDISDSVVQNINNKVILFEEQDLKQIVKEALDKKTFTAKSKAEESDVFIISVPTPYNKKSKKADLNHVISAAEMIQQRLKRGNLVILESTVPPKTSLDIIIPLLEKSGLKAGIDFYYVHCPERAIPGNTLNEMINNDRIIGGFDRDSCEIAKKLYSSFVKGKIFTTDLIVAEMTKLMENTFRDVNISLANEFVKICEDLEIDCNEAIRFANLHPRVNILAPGPGVGGHCIAVDPWFIYEKSPKYAKMIKLAREINDSMPDYVVKCVEEIVEKGKISIFGVSYKGNIGDTRESPALKVIKKLIEKGYKISIFDPYVRNFEYKIDELEDSVDGADCIVFLAEHELFKDIDIKKIASLVLKKNILDTRNFLNHSSWEKQGFKVRVLGKRK